jgi:hypothetical protein
MGYLEDLGVHEMIYLILDRWGLGFAWVSCLDFVKIRIWLEFHKVANF